MKPHNSAQIFSEFLTVSACLLVILTLGIISSLDSSVSLEQNGHSQQVLAATAPRVFFYGSEKSLGGGVIALSTQDDPAIEIGGYQISGEATISIYKSNKENLLNYLIHDENNKLLTSTPDTASLQYIGETKKQISGDYDRGTEVPLPIEGSGVWLIHLAMPNINEYIYVVRSGIGSLVKNGDDELVFWSQDLSSKRSLTEGIVTIYQLKDSVRQVVQSQIQNNGITTTSLTTGNDIAIVESKDQIALIPLNLRYLNHNYSYESFTPRERKAEFYIFTDRPIYRPGDTVYFKAIIRDDEDARYTIPTGTAKVTVSDGWQGNLVFDQLFPITGEGSLYGEFQIPNDSKTGWYSLMVNLDPGSDNYQLSSSIGFQVEYYRKPEYSIGIDTPITEYTSGDMVTVSINGSYFSGQPLSNRIVTYKVHTSTFYDYSYLSYIPSLSDDYRYYGYQYGEVIKEGSATFDKNGIASVSFDTKLPNNTTSNIFSIEAEYIDSSGNPAFARKNIIVYAGEFGIYLNDWISLRALEKTAIPLTLKPHFDTSVSNIVLTAKVSRSTWIKFQEPDKKYPSWKEEKEELPSIQLTSDAQGIASIPFTPPSYGYYDFIVSGSDSRGNAIAKTFSFWAYKEGEQIYRYSPTDTEARLSIQTDREDYRYKDTVKLQIYSEIPDRDVFISFDRARLNRYQIVNLNGNSTTIDIPLLDTDIPNITIKTSSFSDYSLDSYSQRLIVSTDPKKLITLVTPDRITYGPGDTVNLNIETTDISGNPVSAETAIWIVDKALFELVRDNNGDIFDAFWHERYDYTSESHSLLGINTQPAAEMGGGCFAENTPITMSDGSTKEIRNVQIGDTVLTRTSENDQKLVSGTVTNTYKHQVAGYFIINGSIRVTPEHRLWINNSWKEAQYLQKGNKLVDQSNNNVIVETIEWVTGKYTVYNLEIDTYQTYFAGGVWVHNQKGGAPRSIFKDTAYWNPAMRTGSDGRAKVTFKLPDNLTTWVVTAVGATPNTLVGQTATEIITNKEIVVRPVLPNILRVGDDMVISSLIQNFTNQDHPFDIGFESEDVKILGVTDDQITIPAKGIEQIYWNIVAEKENESSKLSFFAQASDTKSLGDKVIANLPIKKFGFWNREAFIANEPTTFDVDFDSFADSEKSKIRLSLSPTLLGTLPSAMRYLISYPYGCVEQTTSKLVPAIIAKANQDLFADALDGVDIDEIIEKGIGQLIKYQRPDGGWTWWGYGDSDEFVTAYVLEYLLEAKQLGITVNESTIQAAKEYFHQTISNSTPEKQIIYAYGKSLTGTKSEIIVPNNSLPPDILSLAIITNIRNGFIDQAQNGVSILETTAKTQGDGVYWDSGTIFRFGSNDASTAFAIRALVEANGSKVLSTKATRYLLRNRTNQYWSNTFATAQIIRAVVDKAKFDQEITTGYSYTVLLDDVIYAKGNVTDYQRPIEDIIIPYDKFLMGKGKISIEKTSNEGVLYSTLLVEEFITNSDAPASSNGISIFREYSNEKGVGYSIAVGDIVNVQLTVSGLSTQENFAVIEDELPAGMIPINPNLDNEQYSYSETNWWRSGIRSREVTANGIILGLYSLAPGDNKFSYKARVVSEGTFQIPPATVSLMYAPELNGHSKAEKIIIDKTSTFTPPSDLSYSENSSFPYRLVTILSISILSIASIAYIIHRKRK